MHALSSLPAILATDLDAFWVRDPLPALLPHLGEYDYIGSMGALKGQWPADVFRLWERNFTLTTGWFIARRTMEPVYRHAMQLERGGCSGKRGDCNDQTAVNQQLAYASGLDGPSHWQRQPRSAYPIEFAATLPSAPMLRLAVVSRGFVCRGNCDKLSGRDAAVMHVHHDRPLRVRHPHHPCTPN